MTNFRVGIGYDVHHLVEGRRCLIGGVEINFPKGPLGHSDGDVLLHAICDALLGAANLGDMGDHFPPADPKFKNADSKIMLKSIYSLVMSHGYILNNLDSVVVCEDPKIKPHREEVKNSVAKILQVSPDLISIKATTEEKMGFTGSGEGIAAWAYVSLIKK